MTDSEIHGLKAEFREQRSRYIYFLMSAAGASIGYAITQVDTLPFTAQNAPIFLAFLAWATSFWSGIKRLNINANDLSVEIHFLSAMGSSLHPRIKEALEGTIIKKTRPEMERKLAIFGQAQLLPLFLGAFLMIIWKVCQAYPSTFVSN